ncbi:MAG: hypothetical protein ACKVOP_04860 [Sphingomonadaceae bacterium]
MKRARLALTACALLTTAAGPAPAPTIGAIPEAVRSTPRLTPFAPQLSDRPVIAAPVDWRRHGKGGGWPALMTSTPATRQAARWAYANHQIARRRAPEALGALQVMGQDEPDLALVPAYQLALGAAYAMLDRSEAAVAALSDAALRDNSEACVWRMMALAHARMNPEALGQIRCALPALNARTVTQRAPFLLSAARAAGDQGRHALVLQLVAVLPKEDAAANLLRGRAEIALGRRPQGQFLLTKAGKKGTLEQRLDAELSVIEDAARNGPLSPEATARLRQIRFIWRRGDLELRALRLSYAEAQRAHDPRATLDAGATLFRYFGGGPDRLTLVAELRATLAATLAPGNPMPLDQVAGLYWDYRDLTPAGADGDLLVTQLADRLQAAGLYERAAELLDHQLHTRMRDIAQGPLSARVATLFILAGKPKRALAAIRDTEGNTYPDDMRFARHRVEAVALDQLGRANEALAVLQDVPDGELIRGELHWRRQDWKALAETTLPAAGRTAMSDVVQARVLRVAIALAMLGRESDLAALRAQYRPAFAKLPAAPAFDALTAPVEAVDPATISAAMAAIPSASPAGAIGDLIDAAPPVAQGKGA